MAITSAKAITSATISWVLTSAKAIRSAYIYGNNIRHIQFIEIMKFNIFSYTFLVFKIIGITFSSDLRKPCWITGKSLSPYSKKCPVLENNHISGANMSNKINLMGKKILHLYIFCNKVCFISMKHTWVLLCVSMCSVLGRAMA